VAVLLRYIENQDSDDVFLDFLEGQRGPQDDQEVLAGWRREVANGDTYLGYADWQVHQAEAKDLAP
jgi:hypothetical protein